MLRGECFDIGMATRTALTIWRDFLGRDSWGVKKKKEEEEEEEEKDEVGVDTHLAGQVLIHKALKHEVCSPSSPQRAKKKLFLREKYSLERFFLLIIPLLPPSSSSLSSSRPPIKPILFY